MMTTTKTDDTFGFGVQMNDGSELVSWAVEQRVELAPEQIPEHLKQAIVAIEDADFYEHEVHAAVYPGFDEITYPQSVGNCQACHAEGTFYAARSTARPVSTDAGLELQNWTDDTANSATSAACVGCHSSAAAKSHMTTNGGIVEGIKGEMPIPSSLTESCLLCHGPGRIADTAAAHGQL